MSHPPSVVMQVPLRIGLDESVDPAHTPPGLLTRLVNGVWEKAGRVEKRDGTELVPITMIDGADPPAQVEKLLARGSELACTDGARLYSRSSLGWRDMGNLPELQATWEPAIDTPNASAPNIDAAGDVIALAWVVDDTDLFVAIRDADGGIIVPPTFVASVATAQARVFVTAAGVASVFYIDGASGFVRARTVSATGVSAATTITSSASTFDVAWNGTQYVLFWYISSGPSLHIRFVSTSFVSGADVTVTQEVFLDALCVCAAPEAVYVAWANGTTEDVIVRVHNATTLAVTAGPTVVRSYGGGDIVDQVAITRRDASTAAVVWCEGQNIPTHTKSLDVTRTTGAVVANSERTTFNTRLVSGLFVLGSRVYAALATVRGIELVAGAAFRQTSAFVVEIESSPHTGDATTPHRLVAMHAPRESGSAVCPKVPVVGTSAFFLASIAVEAPTIYLGSSASVRLVTLSTELDDPWRSAALGSALVLSGGYLATYEGRHAFPASYVQPPFVADAVVAGGGNQAAGDYSYCFVYEWRGSDGVLHRSAPSQPYIVSLGALDKVTFTLECTGPSGRANFDVGFGSENPFPVRIVPYRTTVGGTTFYRMTFGAINVIENDPTSATIQWEDTRSDSSFDGSGAALSTRPILYTTGGILDEVCPPAFVTVRVHRGRLWGLAGDRRTLWFSKRFTEDTTIFPGFHEAMRVVIDAEVVAIESLDDKLIIFTKRGIYALYGDGPLSTGLQSDFGDPTLVHGDMPCLTARSIVAFPGGIAFQSPLGLHLLTRELEVVWFGRPVLDDIPSGALVLSAVHEQHKSSVRFALGPRFVETIPGEGDSSIDVYRTIVLVYDYDNGFWSRFEYPSASYSEGASEVVCDGSLYLAQELSPAFIAVETSAMNLDENLGSGPTWATLDFELTLVPSGQVAWQHMRRVQLLGERQTHHDLRIRFAFDHAATYAQDVQYTAEHGVTHKDCPTIHIGSQGGANPSAKAIRIRVTDGTPTTPGTYPVTTGKGGWFTAIGLEFVPKPGLPRHGARNSKV